MSTKALQKQIEIKRELLIREARKSFYVFCKCMNSEFYKDDRPHLKLICDTLQALYEGKLIKDGRVYKKLQLSLPPGHGKSYTVQLFSMWLFGINIKNEIVSVSYNEKLSEQFGKAVRDGIEEKIEGDLSILNYNDIFPATKLKYGSASKSNWSLEGRHHSYLATSFNGTLTGMRGNIGIIDDPVKDAETAYNENELQNQWNWYCNTFLSRMVEGSIQILVGTRWSSKDLFGRLLELEPDEWYVLKLPAYDRETDTMLCPSLLSKESYLSKQKLMNPEIFIANYQQICIDIQNRLYSSFKTYKPNELPEFEQIISYCDTADTGNDYLCNIIAGIYDRQAYVLDVYYTQDAMEITEPEVAKRLYDNNVNVAHIESNNGGRGFARNVERILRQVYKTRRVIIRWFHQSKNKKARILSNASNVMNNLIFPENWNILYPDYYEAMTSCSRKGKNKFDDAPDCTTGLLEKMDSSKGWGWSKC